MRFSFNENQMASPFPIMPGMGGDFSQLSQMAQRPGMGAPMQTQFGNMQANFGNMTQPPRWGQQAVQQAQQQGVLPQFLPRWGQQAVQQATAQGITPKPYVPPGGPVTSVNPGMQNLPQTGMLSNPLQLQQQQFLNDPSRPYGTPGPMGMLTPQRMDMKALMRNPAEIQRRNQYYSGL